VFGTFRSDYMVIDEFRCTVHWRFVLWFVTKLVRFALILFNCYSGL
jgi:hypothetical protein